MKFGHRPLVSVIIPLYNKSGTLARAIRSVVQQTYSNFEMVIVDDGSTDSSPAVSEQITDARIRLIHQGNAGPGAARNNGVAQTSGEILAFLDADDEWNADYLQSAVSMLLQEPSAKACVCGYDAGGFRNERPNKVRQLRKRGIYPPPIESRGRHLKLHVDAMHSSCVVVYRETFNRLGGYFSRDGCRYGEDSFLWASLLLSEAVIWNPAELVRFHVEDSTLGFAAGRRETARPISIFPEEFKNRVPMSSRDAADRLVRRFAALDFLFLLDSGAQAAASQLCRKHRLSPKWIEFEAVLDRVKRVLGGLIKV